MSHAFKYVLFGKTIFICHRGLQRYPEELYLR